jgi:hypothetical protein
VNGQKEKRKTYHENTKEKKQEKKRIKNQNDKIYRGKR